MYVCVHMYIHIGPRELEKDVCISMFFISGAHITIETQTNM